MTNGGPGVCSSEAFGRTLGVNWRFSPDPRRPTRTSGPGSNRRPRKSAPEGSRRIRTRRRPKIHSPPRKTLQHRSGSTMSGKPCKHISMLCRPMTYHTGNVRTRLLLSMHRPRSNVRSTPKNTKNNSSLLNFPHRSQNENFLHHTQDPSPFIRYYGRTETFRALQLPLPHRGSERRWGSKRASDFRESISVPFQQTKSLQSGYRRPS